MATANPLRLPDLNLPEPLLARLYALADADGLPAVMYARISQDRVGAHLGADRQIEDMCDLCARQRLRLVGVYADNDISAYTGKHRPDYIEMVESLTEGAAKVVLAWHTDRLYRPRGTELEDYITVCETRDIPTHTVQAGALDLTTANGRLNARIAGAVARHESEQKSERLRRQRRQVQESGGHHGGRRAFGFSSDHLSHHPTEAEMIRRGTETVLAGGSLDSVAAAWNAAGVTTVTGKKFRRQGVRAILIRPSNAGLVGNRKTVVGPAKWEPIVPPERWYALRALVDDPARRTDQFRASRILFGTGMYRCECGGRIGSGGNTVTGKPRYSCDRGDLRRMALPVDDLVRLAVEQLLNRERGKLVPPTKDMGPLRDQLVVLKARQREIAELLGDPDSGMTLDQFRAANTPLRDKIDQLEAVLRRSASRSVLSGVADGPDPVAAFRAAGLDRQRAIAAALVSVTVLKSGPGRVAGGRYFDPRSVRIEPKY